MGELVQRDEKGALLFGRDALQGWLSPTKCDEGKGAERTLRNAFLAALSAECAGDAAKAYAIWTHRLATGETIHEAIASALPQHVASLALGRSGFTTSKDDVQKKINAMSAVLDARPALTHWETNGVKVCLWTWPSTGAWYAVEFLPSERGRVMQRRPVPLEEPTFADQMGVPNDWDAHDEVEEQERAVAPKPEQATGTTYGPATPWSVSGNAVSFAIGADSDSDGDPSESGFDTGNALGYPLWLNATDVDGLRLVNAQDQGLGVRRLTLAQVRFLLAVDTRTDRAQRRSKSYRSCEICARGVAHRAEDDVDRYVTITGRRRAHTDCARTWQPYVATLIELTQNRAVEA